MRSSISVRTHRPLFRHAQWFAGKALGLVSVVCLSSSLSAQSGSVAFSVDSFKEIDLSVAPAEYAFADRIFTYRIGSTGSAPSTLFLRNFDTHTQFNDSADLESFNTHTIVAEYLGFAYGTDGSLQSVTEHGYLAMQIPIGETGETLEARERGVVGFIRTSQNPSELVNAAAPGYFDGFRGTLSWDYQAEDRVVLLESNGNTHIPATSTFASLSHDDEGATLSNLRIPVSGNNTDEWVLNPSDLILNDDLTRTDPAFTFLGSLQIQELPAAENLPVINSANPVEPTSFQYDYYILRLIDESDFDQDGIPDFVDLTGVSNVLGRPNHATEQFGFTRWFFSPFFDTWYNSTVAAGNWDYSMKLGWVYDPNSDGVFNPDSFWFYIHTPAANATQFGWVWTSQAVHPWFYRAADDTWIELRSSVLGSQSTFFNLSTSAEETLQF